MVSTVRGILFDLDETLHSREEALWRWLEDEAHRCGASERLDREAVARLDRRGRGDKARLLAYLSEIFDWGPRTAEYPQRFRAGLAAHLRLEPGVPALLMALREQYHVGLVSNGSSESQRLKLRTLGIENSFDPVVISGEVGFRKPDPRIFVAAVATWNVPLEAILFVGDDPDSDIRGATQVGMQAVRVGSDGDIESVSLLPNWLRRP